MKNATVSIITPTTGKRSLFNLIESITKQNTNVKHILLWDDFRENDFVDKMTPDYLEKVVYCNDKYTINNIIIKGSTVQGLAKGSALRAIGLMAAQTEFVTFADDDIMWEENHLETMLNEISKVNPKNEKPFNWVCCKRKIWTKLDDTQFEYLGVDNFESVGEDAKTPYKMIDNNCMLFRRRFGVSAAPLYRETDGYNDDRLFYDFMKKYAGDIAKTNIPSINQVCPDKLIEFFRSNCTKI